MSEIRRPPRSGKNLQAKCRLVIPSDFRLIDIPGAILDHPRTHAVDVGLSGVSQGVAARGEAATAVRGGEHANAPVTSLSRSRERFGASLAAQPQPDARLVVGLAGASLARTGCTRLAMPQPYAFGERRHDASIRGSVPLPFPLPTAFDSATMRQKQIDATPRIAAICRSFDSTSGQGRQGSNLRPSVLETGSAPIRQTYRASVPLPLPLLLGSLSADLNPEHAPSEPPRERVPGVGVDQAIRMHRVG
jgi:hypothetical protein